VKRYSLTAIYFVRLTLSNNLKNNNLKNILYYSWW